MDFGATAVLSQKSEFREGFIHFTGKLTFSQGYPSGTGLSFFSLKIKYAGVNHMEVGMK